MIELQKFNKDSIVYKTTLDRYKKSINLAVNRINKDWEVISKNKNIVAFKDKFICTCEDFKKRNVVCKHIIAVLKTLKNKNIIIIIKER